MKMFDHWGRVAAGAGMLGTGGAGLIEYAKAQMDLAKTFMSEVQKKQLEADYAGVIKGRQTMAEHAAALPFIGPETQAKESVISKEMWNRPDASAALSGAKAGAAEQAKIAATVRSMGLDPASPEGQAAAARMQADNRPEPVKLLDAAGVQGPERSKALTGAITGSAPTPEQKNFEYGKGAPGFEQYQLQQKQAGRPLNLGTIPEGYQLVATPDGTYRMQKVPGSAADIAEQQKAVAANRSKDIVTQEIDRALPMIGYTTSGTLGAVTQNIPGMPGHDLQNLIGTIRANVGIDSLQQMRASSPTGAALGNVTETENKTLQSVLGSLNQTQSPDQLRENLTRLRAVYHDIVFGSPGQLDALTRAGKITPEQRDAALAQRASPGQEGGLKPLDEGAATKARDAISKGAPRDAVIKRLRESGYDTNGL